ncbi:MAG: nucleotidyltransferase domain-containing protein [Candidatus Electronema sp. V4]|uniref:nucleotidyltransferase domain-containing protein n=1 Tax=Candidatus Electronema sp. V4 TaxID=3454756 RepID=UPI0040555F54
MIDYFGIKKYYQMLLNSARKQIEILDKRRKYIVDNHSCFNITNHSTGDKSNSVLDKISSTYNKSLFFDLVIHGSYADNTYTSASDVDDMVIINRRAFEKLEFFIETKRILYELNTYYQYIDPVQHHGHWMITEFDLLNYNQSVMPVCVLYDALSIDKELQLDIYINKEKSKQGFYNTLDVTLRTYKMTFNMLYLDKINLFYLKVLISCISLLIPLLFEINGQIFNKKNAILRSYEILDDQAMKILDWSTFIRKNWDKLPSVKSYIYIRLISKIIKNRSILECIARKKMPRISFKDIPGLNELKKSDFNYFSLFIENKKNETYK